MLTTYGTASDDKIVAMTCPFQFNFALFSGGMYQYGTLIGDTSVPLDTIMDANSITDVTLNTPFIFFGVTYSTVYVCVPSIRYKHYIDGLLQDSCISIAIAMEILPSCAKPSI